jgi:hypothetical protein
MTVRLDADLREVGMAMGLSDARRLEQLNRETRPASLTPACTKDWAVERHVITHAVTSMKRRALCK